MDYDPFDLLEPYLKPTPLVIVISGPSGAGKDSVLQELKQKNLPFHFVVTTTNRAKRPKEVDGLDYNFVSTAEFERMIANDEFIEHAQVYDHYKGVPEAQVREALASGLDVIMRLDVQGAATVKKRFPESITIFLVPPSLDTLVLRLNKRKTDTPEQIQMRLENALSEIERSSEFDYIVINEQNNLSKAAEEIQAIIRAEKCKTVHQQK